MKCDQLRFDHRAFFPFRIAHFDRPDFAHFEWRSHNALNRTIGPPAEALEVAEAVERIRRFWRPTNVRVLLLAESHVFTSSDELNIRLKTDLIPVTKAYPNEYVRFVYCLGYGESRLLSEPVNRNFGTWQFWKILHACQNGGVFDDFLVSKTQFENRILAKYRLLERLKATGVWLVDASITALYNRGQRPAPRTVEKTLQTCWDSYVGHVVKEAAPHHVIVVGKSVERTLKQRLESTGLPFTVVPQPQARLSAIEQASELSKYTAICQGIDLTSDEIKPIISFMTR